MRENTAINKLQPLQQSSVANQSRPLQGDTDPKTEH